MLRAHSVQVELGLVPGLSILALRALASFPSQGQWISQVLPDCTVAEINSPNFMAEDFWEIPHRVKGLARVGDVRAEREGNSQRTGFLISNCS